MNEVNFINLLKYCLETCIAEYLYIHNLDNIFELIIYQFEKIISIH